MERATIEPMLDDSWQDPDWKDPSWDLGRWREQFNVRAQTERHDRRRRWVATLTSAVIAAAYIAALVVSC